MMIRTFLAVGLVLTSFGLGPAMAQNTASGDDAKALSYMRSQGVSLVDIGADCGGLAGALGQKDGKLQTFYVSPDGTHIVAGVCFRAGGVNVTGLQLERLTKATNGPTIFGGAATASQDLVEAPAAEGEAPVLTAAEPPERGSTGQPPEVKDPKALLAAAESAAWFPVGAKEAPVVYFVADPRCTFCHAMWKAMAPAVYDGKAQIRIILVGMLGPDSVNDAKTILALQNPAMAWLGGVGNGKAPAPVTDAKALETGEGFLKRNELFRKGNQIGGVPFLIYQTAEGVKTHYGADNPEEAFDALLGEL